MALGTRKVEHCAYKVASDASNVVQYQDTSLFFSRVASLKISGQKRKRFKGKEKTNLSVSVVRRRSVWTMAVGRQYGPPKFVSESAKSTVVYFAAFPRTAGCLLLK